jgi:hypothetical protein
MTQTAIASWKPARRHPETYPGACPDGAYVIIDDQVHPLVFAVPGALDSAHAVVGGRSVPLDPLLHERGCPPLGERYISLAYGANRNPGTLAIKMHNYGYGHENGLVLPVLKGATLGRDVVACGLSGQGYLYADLLPAEVDAREVRVDAWFPLLDPEQLRVMHDGEHVRNGTYTVARFPSHLDGFERMVDALGYAGNAPIFVSPTLGTPIAYSTVTVTDRSLPAMDATEMIDHILDIGDLRQRVPDLLGRTEAVTTPELMAFMNERWWIGFTGQAQPDDSYDLLVAALADLISAHQRPPSSATRMRARGLCLTVDDAYTPGAQWRLDAQLGG